MRRKEGEKGLVKGLRREEGDDGKREERRTEKVRKEGKRKRVDDGV